MAVETAAQRDFGNEMLTVYCAKMPQDALDGAVLDGESAHSALSQDAAVRSAG
jgi:hypothetical protein